MNTEAVAVTFEDVEKLIYSTIHSYRRRHGGNFEDLLDQSLEVFMTSYRTFDPDQGAFQGWLYFKLWTTMQETRRVATRHNAKLRRVEVNLKTLFRKPNSFNWELLSEDAQVILRTATEMPKARKPELYQQKLAAVLEQEGWKPVRIKKGFEELKSLVRR